MPPYFICAMDMTALWELWERALNERDLRKRAAVNNVARREWSAEPRHSLRPMYFERFPPRGRLLDLKTVLCSGGAAFEYGFDAQGRLLSIRDPSPWGPLLTVYRYEMPVVEAVTYHERVDIPTAVERFEYEGDYLLQYSKLGLPDRSPVTSYPGSKTIENVTTQFGWQALIESYQYGDGKITEIRCQESGTDLKEIIYTFDPQNPTTGVPSTSVELESLTQKTVSYLLEAIPASIVAAHIRETLCAVALIYAYGEFYAPPLIVLGREAKRQAYIQKNGPSSLVWIPPVFDSADEAIPLIGKEVLTVCEQWTEAIDAQSAWEEGRTALRSLAYQLTRRDWSGIVNVAPDFVVFAVDYDLVDLERALQASASAQQFQKWKSARFI